MQMYRNKYWDRSQRKLWLNRIKIHEKIRKKIISYFSFYDVVFRLAETIRLTVLVELGEESILPPLLLQLLEHLALACHLAASF